MKKTFISVNKKNSKRLKTEARNNFYLSFFNNPLDGLYEEIKINGFWLVKQWNPEKNQPQCALYTQESYDKYKNTEKQTSPAAVS